MAIMFENYDRKIDKINAALNANGIANLDEAYEICKAKGLDPYQTAKSIQPICFEDVCWAYVALSLIHI